MSNDSETVEDTKKSSLAEVTDDSCRVEFIEIVPLDRESDVYSSPEFVYPVVDLHETKQEPADESNHADLNYSLKQEPADEYETEFLSFAMPVQVRVLLIFN